MKFLVMKTYEVEQTYEVEADSKEQALRLADSELFSEFNTPTSSTKTKPEIVHIQDSDYECEEWTPSYVRVYQCFHCKS